MMRGMAARSRPLVDRRLSRTFGTEPMDRVLGFAAVPDLEVKPRSDQRPRIAHRSDHSARNDVVSDIDCDSFQMSEYREVLIAVVEDDDLAVAAKPAGETHLAGRDCAHRGTPLGIEFDPFVEGLGVKLGIDDPTESFRDRRHDRSR